MKRFAACVLAGLLLAGCWGRLETNELELVVGYAVDWTGGQYVVTAAMVNARAVAAPGTTPQNPTGPETVYRVGKGRDPAAAFAEVNRVSPRHPLWASAEVVVIGEALARKGIMPVIDTLIHEPWYKPTTRVLIAHDDASALYATRASGPEISVSRQLTRLVENAHRDESVGWAPHVFDVFRDDREPGRSLLIAAITEVPPPAPTAQTFQVTDSAVLRHGRLIAWMPAPLTRTVLWITGDFVHGTYVFACPGANATAGAVYVNKARRRVTPIVADGRLVRMNLRLTARATAVKPCAGAGDSRTEEAAAAAIARGVRRSIAWAEGHGADVFGWGAALYAAAPAVWRVAYAGRWPEAFAHLPVALKMDVVVTESGMVNPP